MNGAVVVLGSSSAEHLLRWKRQILERRGRRLKKLPFQNALPRKITHRIHDVFAKHSLHVKSRLVAIDLHGCKTSGPVVLGRKRNTAESQIRVWSWGFGDSKLF
jgi:hypothetical protein